MEAVEVTTQRIQASKKIRLWVLLFLLLGSRLYAAPQEVQFQVFEGKLGQHDILLEFAKFPNTHVLGRYCYRKSGVDIFLGGSSTNKKISLSELRIKGWGEPSSEGMDDTLETISTGHWEVRPKGVNLVGTWRSKPNGKSLAIRLSLVGHYPRILDIDPDKIHADLEAWMAPLNDGDPSMNGIDPATTLYAYQKLNIPFQAGPESSNGEVAWHMVKDPYLGLTYPRLKRHPNPKALAWVNRQLEQSHWGRILKALYVSAADAYILAPWAGGDGGYAAHSRVEVHYCSKSLFSLVESGSLFFGGAHPINNWDPITFDLLKMEYLEFNSLLKLYQTEGDASNFHPLFSKRFENLPKTRSECECPEYLPAHLGLHFSAKGLVLGITGIGHALGCCLGEQDVIPFEALAPYLRSKVAERYFPEQCTLQKREEQPSKTKGK